MVNDTKQIHPRPQHRHPSRTASPVLRAGVPSSLLARGACTPRGLFRLVGCSIQNSSCKSRSRRTAKGSRIFGGQPLTPPRNQMTLLKQKQVLILACLAFRILRMAFIYLVFGGLRGTAPAHGKGQPAFWGASPLTPPRNQMILLKQKQVLILACLGLFVYWEWHSYTLFSAAYGGRPQRTAKGSRLFGGPAP